LDGVRTSRRERRLKGKKTNQRASEHRNMHIANEWTPQERGGGKITGRGIKKRGKGLIRRPGGGWRACDGLWGSISTFGI